MIKNMIQTNHTIHHIPHIQANYLIHEDTLALIPALAIDYDITALETEQVLPIKQTAINLIRQACKKYAWTTYKGRTQAIRLHTGFRNRIPIPLTSQLTFFPTTAIKDFNNIWLNYQQIKSIQAKSHASTTIIFRNHTDLTIPLSHHRIEQQMMRAHEVTYRINQNI